MSTRTPLPMYIRPSFSPSQFEHVVLALGSSHVFPKRG
jgi:hypothetical protein